MSSQIKIKLGAVVLFLIALLFPLKAESFVYQDRITTSKSLAHYAMGNVYDLLGISNMAVTEYEKAAQFDSSSYLIHLRLGTSYARMDMLEEAKRELDVVKQLNPEDLQSHYLLALIYSSEKEYDKAADEYEFILTSFSKEEPKNIEIYGYLGQLYYSQKKFSKAIEQFEKILELEPDNADVMYLLGSLYLEVNEDEKAIKILKDSLAIDPEHDGSLNTLGYIYAEQGKDLDEAEKLIRKALEISPDNGAYLDSLGWVYYHKGDYKKALEILSQANENLKDPVIFDHMADVYLKINDYENAILNWEKSLELLPDQPEVKKKLDEAKSIQVRSE